MLQAKAQQPQQTRIAVAPLSLQAGQRWQQQQQRIMIQVVLRLLMILQSRAQLQLTSPVLTGLLQLTSMQQQRWRRRLQQEAVTSTRQAQHRWMPVGVQRLLAVAWLLLLLLLLLLRAGREILQLALMCARWVLLLPAAPLQAAPSAQQPQLQMNRAQQPQQTL